MPKFRLLDGQEEHIDAVVIALDPSPRFKVGDKVKAIAFVNCFGKQVEEVSGLTVTKVTKHGEYLPVYYRIVAEHPDRCAQCRMVEGAERFFEFDGTR